MENLIILRQREAEFFGGVDYAARSSALEAAHAEALEMDKQATHFRKVQTALSRRVAVIMGKTPA